MSNKIHCIAVDDEPLAIEIISDYISRIPFLTLDRSFDNAIEAIAFLNENKVDLAFLDIHMEGLMGTQMVRVIKNPPEVIFTTAYDQYAVEGFELNAADYLMKPISFERFVQSVDRVYEKLVSSGSERATQVSKSRGDDLSEKDPFFFVKTENRLQKIRFEEILFIEGQGDYLRINTLTERVMTLMNFNQLEKQLPSGNFIRVHKSYLVAIDKIDSIIRNRIHIGEAIIPISDSYRKEFFQRVSHGGEK